MTNVDKSQSKFSLSINKGATADNKWPAMTGSMTLPEGQEYGIAMWATHSTRTPERRILTGQVHAKQLGAALDQATASTTSDAKAETPGAMDIRPGQIVLFQNLDLGPDNKRPNWWGYVRTAEGLFRTAAWERAGQGGRDFLAGNVQVYVAPEIKQEPAASGKTRKAEKQPSNG